MRKCGVVVLPGGVQVGARPQGQEDREVEAGLGVARIQGYGQFEIFQGLVVLAPFEGDDAPVIQEADVRGLPSQRPVEQPVGLAQVTVLHDNQRLHPQGLHVVPVCVQHGVQQGQGFLRAPLGLADRGQPHPGLRIVGARGQDLLDPRLRFGDRPPLEQAVRFHHERGEIGNGRGGFLDGWGDLGPRPDGRGLLGGGMGGLRQPGHFRLETRHLCPQAAFRLSGGGQPGLGLFPTLTFVPQRLFQALHFRPALFGRFMQGRLQALALDQQRPLLRFQAHDLRLRVIPLPLELLLAFDGLVQGLPQFADGGLGIGIAGDVRGGRRLGRDRRPRRRRDFVRGRDPWKQGHRRRRRRPCRVCGTPTHPPHRLSKASRMLPYLWRKCKRAPPISMAIQALFRHTSAAVELHPNFQQERRSRDHRHRHRRHLKRGRRLLMVVAVVLIVLDLLLLLMAWFKRGPDRQVVLRIATIYTWAAGACLVLHVVITRLLYHVRERRPETKHTRRGAVLVLALLLTALISALVLQVQWQARTGLARAAALARHTRLQLTAAGAARQALWRLTEDEDLLVDHLDEPWAAVEEYRDPVGVLCTVSVQDEQGLFNLNNLAANPVRGQRTPGAVLLDILVACGIAQPLAKVEALEDWVRGRGRDSGGGTPFPGLDEAEQGAARPLVSWQELLRVEGLDRAMFERRERGPLVDPLRGDLVDAVTVLPPRAARVTPVNVNTAGRDALRGVVGLEYSALVERLLRERASRPLRNLEALGLSPEMLAAVGSYLDVRSSYFRVTATAEQDHDAAEVRALAVRDDKGGVRLVHWVSR